VQIHQFTCRDDNFGVLIHDPATGACAAIDAPDENAMRKALAQTGWRLSHILVTHKHYDHIEAVLPLQQDFGCAVIAPKGARGSVPAVDLYVGEGDTVEIGSLHATIWETPGHCADHILYHFADEAVAFAGDVLFALGCGRVFDGAYEDMWRSLERVAGLPDQTRVYFGHEYTLANAKFALSVDPDNAALRRRFAEVVEVRARGEATCPTTIGQEKAANPFLQASNPAMKARLGMAGQSDAAVFRELRERKNRF